MGWLFTRNATKKDIIRELTAPEEDKRRRLETVAHCLRGNVLWTVVEVTDKQQGNRKRRGIVCNLLDRQGDGWGYKNIPEEMHPFYYSCPLAYLELAPVACEKWREAVRAYHRERGAGRKLRVGQRVAVVSGCNVPGFGVVPWVRIRSLQPLQGIYQGLLIELQRRHLGEVLPETSEVVTAG